MFACIGSRYVEYDDLEAVDLSNTAQDQYPDHVAETREAFGLHTVV